MTSQRPLDGVTVVDCSQILAGPFCTMHLADMGANVIKVEKPRGGDDTRRMGPPFLGGESAAFLQLNRNKRSIVLDLRAERGKEILKSLARKADILIENGRPGAMNRLGLGYEDVHAVNPALVYCSISGFGLTGPYSRRPGFDLIAQGMSGLMSFNGFADGPPAKIGSPVADLNAGMFALSNILAAYVHRLRTGEGQHVDVSLLESGIAYTVWESAAYFATGDVPGPLGSGHRLLAPYEAFQTADGWVNIGAANQANWERLARAIGREDLLEDERFASNATRMENLPVVREEIGKTMASRTSEEWLPVLEEAGVPAGPIFDMADVWSNEHVRAREMDVVLDHPTAGEIHNIGVPVKLSRTPGQITTAAPTLGQHTEEILAEAGCDADEIAALIADGVAGPDA